MLAREIAAWLPDEARWVEARACLLEGSCEVFGGEEGWLVRDRHRTVYVLGAVDRGVARAVIDAAADVGIVAAPEDGDWIAGLVPGWTRSRIVVHELASLVGLPDSAHVVSLSAAEIEAAELPEELAEELAEAREDGATIVGVRVAGRPVAFSYAGAVTERWWDISIDTLEAHRRRGYAGACVSALIRRFWGEGKRPVWQAVVDNPGSWRLAAKLGFVAVGELVMFERDG